MKKNRKYLVAAALVIFASIALMTLIGRSYLREPGSNAPARTSAEELAQLANYTRISVQGDFTLEIDQVQDYSIEYMPLDATTGELQAHVENDTLIVTGFGNRTAAAAALLRIGVPVLDTLEVNNLPQITVSNFSAPLMNVRLQGFDSFTLQDSTLGSFTLDARGGGKVTLRGNTLTNQDIRIEDEGDGNTTSE